MEGFGIESALWQGQVTGQGNWKSSKGWVRVCPHEHLMPWVLWNQALLVISPFSALVNLPSCLAPSISHSHGAQRDTWENIFQNKFQMIIWPKPPNSVAQPCLLMLPPCPYLDWGFRTEQPFTRTSLSYHLLPESSCDVTSLDLWCWPEWSQGWLLMGPALSPAVKPVTLCSTSHHPILPWCHGNQTEQHRLQTLFFLSLWPQTKGAFSMSRFPHY